LAIMTEAGGSLQSESAHAASLTLDHVRERIARAMPLVDVTGIRQQRLDPRAGLPDPPPHAG